MNKKIKLSEESVVNIKRNTIEFIETFDNPHYWMGYKFTISDSTKNITCKIENSKKCCEKYGMHTKSNLNDFIGAEYHSVDISEERNLGPCEEMSMVNIIIHTNRGDITINFYNEHNGYYSHDVFIQTYNGIINISI